MAEQPPSPDGARRKVIGLVLVLSAASITYRLVHLTGAEKTSALYVGVPAVLAIGLALLPRSGSATGMLMKGGTLALLLACVLLPEGLICLLFALPLVALVALIVGGATDLARRRRDREGPALMAVALPLLVLSLEGIAIEPIDPHDAVVATMTVEASPAVVEAALAATPVFDDDLPTFLTVGFNRPVGASGSGLSVGDERRIEFSGGSHDDHPLRLLDALFRDGHEGHGGHGARSTMRLEVSGHEPGQVVFDIRKDDTMLSRWVDLDRAIVTWDSVDDQTTEISWRLEYERLLAPAFYFGPLQRFGLHDAADYLLTSLFGDLAP